MTDYRTVTVETLAAALDELDWPTPPTGTGRPYREPEAARSAWVRELFAALPPTPAGPLRGKVFIRTPDETQEWTAWGDVVPGIPYQYISGGFIVRVELTATEPREAIELRDDGYIVPARTPRCPIGYCTATEDCPHTAAEPREDFADPTAVDHPLYADQATEPREDRLTCARYFGSDGTLCSTHNARFASPEAVRCRAVLHPDTPEAPE